MASADQGHGCLLPFEALELLTGGLVGAEVESLVGATDAVGVVVEAEVAPRDEVDEVAILRVRAAGGCLYAYSTAADGNRIQRFTLDGNPGRLGLGAPETILERLPSASYHNGGRIAFGPDAMLYATVGDAGDSESAQDLDALSGKILRMTPTGGVPRNNPFPGSLVYSYGHRNPQGIAWAADGTMYASEFGQNTWDELNTIRPGANYGWPIVEGIAGRREYVDPLQQWSPADASPSGIAVHDDTIVIANLRGQRLRLVPTDKTRHLDRALRRRLRPVARCHERAPTGHCGS